MAWPFFAPVVVGVQPMDMACPIAASGPARIARSVYCIWTVSLALWVK